LKTLLPQKLPDVSFTNPTSTVRMKLLNFLLVKVMLRRINGDVTTTKTRCHAVNYIRKTYVWRTPKQTLNPECLVPTMKDVGGVVIVWELIS
jgi:hypothetical protein